MAFNPTDVIGPGLATVLALLTRGGGASQAIQQNIPPEYQQLLQLAMQRAQYQSPLFQAVTNQAFQGLPAYARQGLSLPSALPAASGSTPTGSAGIGAAGTAGAVGLSAVMSLLAKDPALLAKLKGLLPGGANIPFVGPVDLSAVENAPYDPNVWNGVGSKDSGIGFGAGAGATPSGGVTDVNGTPTWVFGGANAPDTLGDWASYFGPTGGDAGGATRKDLGPTGNAF